MTGKPIFEGLAAGMAAGCVLWRDDAQIVSQHATKDYLPRPGVHVEVLPVAELRAPAAAVADPSGGVPCDRSSP